MKYFLSMTKVEAPVIDHLRDLRADGEEYEVVEIFPMQEDRKYGDSKIFKILCPKLKFL